MRRLLVSICIAGLVIQPSAALAQTDLSYAQQFSATSTVIFLPFEVSGGGTFAISTSGLANLDPNIWLFSGAYSSGPVLGAALANNDDGAHAQAGWNVCSGAGGTCHSLIEMFLSPGWYTVASGVYQLTEAEARSGIATFGTDQPRNDYCNFSGDYSTCNLELSIVSQDGTVAPEPASMLLLGSGLLGLGGFVRRRRLL